MNKIAKTIDQGTQVKVLSRCGYDYLRNYYYPLHSCDQIRSEDLALI